MCPETSETLFAGADIGVSAPDKSTTSTTAQPDYQNLIKQSAAEAAEWKNRFAGLQGKYQQEKEKWTIDNIKVGDLTSSMEKLTGEKEALHLDHTKLGEVVSQKDIELNTTKAKLERMEIVATEFSHLLPFYKEGLLPDGVGDDLRTKLKTFSEKLTLLGTTVATTTAHDLMTGATPATPASTQLLKPAEVQKEMFEALKTGNVAKYNELYDKLLDVQKTPEGG